MAISFVNSGANSAINGGSITVSLPAMQEGDLVIMAFESPGFTGGNTVDHDMTMTTSGYTEVADLYISTAWYMNLGVFYKFMGSTPDTTAVTPALSDTQNANAACCLIFRGVAPVSQGGPFAITPVTATGTGTMKPNPPSVTPVAAGQWVVIAVGSGQSLGTAPGYSFPAGYTTNAGTVMGDDTVNATAGVAYNSAPASTEDPGLLGHSGTDNTAFSWGAVTMVLMESIPVTRVSTVIAGI